MSELSFAQVVIRDTHKTGRISPVGSICDYSCSIENIPSKLAAQLPPSVPECYHNHLCAMAIIKHQQVDACFMLPHLCTCEDMVAKRMEAISAYHCTRHPSEQKECRYDPLMILAPREKKKKHQKKSHRFHFSSFHAQHTHKRKNTKKKASHRILANEARRPDQTHGPTTEQQDNGDGTGRTSEAMHYQHSNDGTT